MKFDLEMLLGLVCCMLIILFTIQAAEINELKIRVNELKIIVDNKFLPALMLDKAVFEVR